MINAADALARYTLGITGAIIAAWAIWLGAGRSLRRGMDASAGRCWARPWSCYSTALSARFSPHLPSSSLDVINSELFLDLFGFPVELLRAVLARDPDGPSLSFALNLRDRESAPAG